MITETVFNLYPILKYGIIILALFGGLFLLNNLINVVKDIIFKKNDAGITTKLIDKFPLVRPEFYSLNWREQQAENNQEIHEINKRLDALEREVKEKLDTLLERLNNG